MNFLRSPKRSSCLIHLIKSFSSATLSSRAFVNISDLPSSGIRKTRELRSEGFVNQQRYLSKHKSEKKDVEIKLNLLRLVRNFRISGHFVAKLDPLNLSAHLVDSDLLHQSDICLFLKNEQQPNYRIFDLEDVPLDEPYFLGNDLKSTGKDVWTLRELISSFKKTYCGHVSVEYTHIENNARRQWIQDAVEGKYGMNGWSVVSEEEKKKYWRHLLKTDHTLHFLGKRFASVKIFGIDGSEALVPALWTIANTASDLGAEYLEMGMTHRGRMNVLHNFFEKSFGSICNKFNECELYSGDVKFHLGARANLKVGKENKDLHISLCANPSHLEAVYPVVMGKAKAKQFYVGDTEMKRVIPLVLHGDAAFCGQGIVPETMQLSNLPDYTVGGAIHLIINNQIGFTTDPHLARTSYHCTNVAKMIEAPIIHVNGDDVDAVISACKLAVEYRQRFRRDICIDLVCFRRHGHTNKEDPKITQPLTYQLIDAHPSVYQIYSEQLIREGVLTQEEIDTESQALLKSYSKEYEASKEYVPDPLEWLGSNWLGAAISNPTEKPYNQTGVRMESLQSVAEALYTVPETITPHPDVKKIFDSRKKQIETGKISMPFAELLAIGTLLTKFSPDQLIGVRDVSSNLMIPHPTVHVRLSGQDCVRGTFNQRHAGIFCQKTGHRYDPLSHISVPEKAATFSVCNSSLSEAAVLGFEYGYSLENESALTIWEAQFGDFANVAQSIIDNFIVSGETKWNVHSALVMLLPHGYDGQGPEHSSARMERYLQLIDDTESDIPGNDFFSRQEIETAFDNLVANDPIKNSHGEPVVSMKTLMDALLTASPGEKSERHTLSVREILEELEDEDEEEDVLEEQKDGEMINKDLWVKMMSSWLQLNSERKYNFSVVAPSTPAQYFHCLRRQIHRPYAKPVAIMTSKWLLHHTPCTSPLSDFAPGSFFRRVIIEGHSGDNLGVRKPKRGKTTGTATETGTAEEYSESIPANRFAILPSKKIRKVIFCSGKIFYHLFHARRAAAIQDTAFVRLEQIAPFPYDMIGKAIREFPNAELVWVQEEPRNMGAWSYVKPRFDSTLMTQKFPHSPIRFVGRGASAAPATGHYRQHVIEQQQVVAAALEWYN